MLGGELLFAHLHPFHGDELGRADAGAHIASDALVGFALGIDDKLDVTPVTGGHNDFFPGILDGDDGFDEIADGDRHAGKEAVKTHPDIFEVTDHCSRTFTLSVRTQKSFIKKAVSKRFANARGIRIFQAKVINWSNRTRGKVHLNHMMRKIMA